MGSLKDQLMKKGLVSAQAAAKVETSNSAPTPRRPVEPEYLEDCIPAETASGPLPSGDPADYPRWALEWACAGFELLERNRFTAALHVATGGTGRDADAFERKIQVALGNLPKGKAESLQARMRDLWLNPKGRKVGVPTFCGNARVVLDAVRGGAYEAYQAAERAEAEAAASLEVPKPEEGEDLDAYRGQLDVWASDKPAALLARIGFDAWQIVNTECQRREAAEKSAKEAREAAERDELAAILGADSFESVVTGLKEFASRKSAEGVYLGNFNEVILGSRWGWTIYVRRAELPEFCFYSAPTQPPTSEAASLLTDEFVLRQAGHDRGAALKDVVRVRWSLAATQVALVESGKDQDGSPRRFAVYSDGTVVRLYSSTIFAVGTWPTMPDPKGWWHRTEGSEKGTWCSPRVYQAVRRLETARRGAVLITPEVVSRYGRHPEKGYPRFYFEVGAGRRRSSIDIPVWRPQNGEGWLAERLDDIKLVAVHHLPISEAAYWMDVTIGMTQRGNPRLEPNRAGQTATPAILVFTSESAMSNGKWGWSGETHSAVKGSEKGGSKILWSTFVSSSGGGVHRTADLLWITRGGSIAMDSGQAVTFDGEKVIKVAGGGVDPKDDPSRE